MKAIFAGGCFWGMEYYFQKLHGVEKVTSGYIGGELVDPSYEQVKTRTTGHAEAVEVIYDSEIVDYITLAKLFFEIHDPTQVNGQGVDIGPQYRSEIFYLDYDQEVIAKVLIEELRNKGYDVVTNVSAASIFYKAEDYHQNYHGRNGGEPECHFRVKRF